MLRGLLALQGCKIGRRPVTMRMRRMGIEALYRRPRTTKPEPGHKICLYPLRGIEIRRPNQVWAMDITYIPIARIRLSRRGAGLTIWAQRILCLKNQLTTSDAQEVEGAFAAKLSEISDDGVAAPDTPGSTATLEDGESHEIATANGSAGSDRHRYRRAKNPSPYASPMANAFQRAERRTKMDQLGA
jgi:hypothetical protein